MFNRFHTYSASERAYQGSGYIEPLACQHFCVMRDLTSPQKLYQFHCIFNDTKYCLIWLLDQMFCYLFIIECPYQFINVVPFKNITQTYYDKMLNMKLSSSFYSPVDLKKKTNKYYAHFSFSYNKSYLGIH